MKLNIRVDILKPGNTTSANNISLLQFFDNFDVP